MCSISQLVITRRPFEIQSTFDRNSIERKKNQFTRTESIHFAYIPSVFDVLLRREKLRFNKEFHWNCRCIEKKPASREAILKIQTRSA